MKEIRLTLKADQFAEISQFLIDRGVEFRVEPIENAAPKSAPARVVTPPATRRRKPARTAGKSATKRSPKRDALAPSGADRLREALTQKRTSVEAASSTSAEPPYQGGQTGTGISTPPGEHET